ncbi:hypothetical protein ACHQM5_022339 [Ranunculus cassubicifolius]
MKIEKGKTLKEEETGNWAELPEDIMTLIFSKLNTVRILCYAQFVCSYWYKLSKDPQLFQSVVITRTAYLHIRKCNPNTRIRYSQGFNEFGMEAVNRSHGELKEVFIGKDCTDQLLHHIVRSSKNLLRSFRLSSCSEVTDHNMLIEVAKRNPLLEEIEISRTKNADEVIKEIGRCCSNLKCFRYYYKGLFDSHYPVYRVGGILTGDLAYAIAKNMSQLRELYLSGDGLTNNGLRQILKGCENLVYLDLQHCCLRKVKKDLLFKCFSRIKVVKIAEKAVLYDGKDWP